MSAPKSGFDPDPPDCFSQRMGDSLSSRYRTLAKELRDLGRFAQADDAEALALMYGGFMKLVR